MKKIISYIWPITKKVASEINGPLEINWLNGRKVLDSRNTNYSYGTLQKVLTYGLSKITIDPDTEILLLGLGGGSILKPVRETFKCRGKITAVEIDPVVIGLAKEGFDISAIPSLEIVHADALMYVNQCNKQFGLVIIDLFIDDQVPLVFYSTVFWEQVIRITGTNGVIVFNAGIDRRDEDKTGAVVDFLKPYMEVKKYEKVCGINTLIVGKKL